MAASIPDDFERELFIALKMVSRSAKVSLAGKLPHQSDDGCRAVARELVAQLRLTRWTIEMLPPPPLDRGR